MERYPKPGEGGMFILITNRLCIASWKNPEIEDYLIPMVGSFLIFFFPFMPEIVHRGKIMAQKKTEQAQLYKRWWWRPWFKAIPNISKEKHQISLDAGAPKETEIFTCLRLHWTLDTPEVLLFWFFYDSSAGKTQTVSIPDTLVQTFDETETKHRESNINL